MGKYKWFNKMKDSKGKKDYSKMSQEELREEARKIRIIDDDGSTVTIGELIEREKKEQQGKQPTDNNGDITITTDSNEKVNSFLEQIKEYSDKYSKQNEWL